MDGAGVGRPGVRGEGVEVAGRSRDGKLYLRPFRKRSAVRSASGPGQRPEMLVMHDLDRRIGRGRPASVRGGDPAVLLMGFAGAHRRGELPPSRSRTLSCTRWTACMCRLRRSKTPAGGARHGEGPALSAGPRGDLPALQAYVRRRQVLQAWDRADPDGRRAVMTLLRRQAAPAGSRGGEEGRG